MFRALLPVVVALTALPVSAQSPTPPPVWTVEGGVADARLGCAVASAGDVNGDGFDDVIVGAMEHANGQVDEGRAQVHLGSAGGLATTPAWTVESDLVDAYYGAAVARAGDVNGDGFDDVLVGAPSHSNGQSHEGAAYLYLGSAGGPTTVAAWSVESGASGARLGSSLAGAGDVNGDGFDDVVVGVPRWNNGQGTKGRALVYLGSATGLAAVHAWAVESDDSNSEFGRAVASAGDVNGDGFDDVLVGAPSYGHSDFGRAYVYLGSPAGPALTAGWTFTGTDLAGFLGQAIAGAGDVNGDGFDDVLVGQPEADDSDTGSELVGKAYLFLGAASGLALDPARTFVGLAESDYLGKSLAGAGDWNGDGLDDVLLGAWLIGPARGGEATLFTGSGAGLSTCPVLKVTQAQPTYLGTAVAGAGDVNGDGLADVILGASFYANGELREGAAFVYHGVSSPTSSAVHAGDGVNADLVTAVDAVVGSSWSAPLVIGHAHGSGGVLQLLVHAQAVNGPTLFSPTGGRALEFLVGGVRLAEIGGSHDGVTGGVPAQLLPPDATLVGVTWAAQYIVTGGGFVDLSQAVVGVVTGCP